jgi:GNAT superfamily N-acetyltransferase
MLCTGELGVEGRMQIEVRELVPALWGDLERLFGPKGAVGGCWCMWWRQALGEKWEDIKGTENKKRFRALVRSGRAHGVLAYVDGVPVAWVAFDRRRDYIKLDRSPSLACRDADQVWSVPCFFVKPGFRGQGVSAALLAGALRALRAHGAVIVEGYPVRPAADGRKIAAAFAYTGTRSLFAREGFRIVGNRDGGKQRVRLSLR